MTTRRHMLLVALLAALPAIAAFAAFGAIETPDSLGYIEYSGEILNGSVPTGAALLHASPAPISLFRTPGYPALIAALRWAFPDDWRWALVLLQIAATEAVAAASYRVALRLGAARHLAFVAALLPGIGFAVVWQIAILTDALNAACLAAAALALVSGPGYRRAALAGLLLGMATTLREATPVLALAYLPFAWLLGGRIWTRLVRLTLVMLPAILVVASLVAWNEARIGRPLLTTTQQTQMVYALMPAVKRGVPIYDGADAFDRIARETVGSGDYGAIDTLHQRLFAEAGMTAPDMAGAASVRYLRAWLRFPLTMLLTTAQNFRVGYLAMPFEPVDTLALLYRYDGRDPSPAFVKLNTLWSRLRHGDALAGLLLAVVVATRMAGTAIALAGIVLPWLPGRDWRLRGLWLICVGSVCVYLPVHLEPRYMAAVVPLLCVMAAAALRPGPSAPRAA